MSFEPSTRLALRSKSNRLVVAVLVALTGVVAFGRLTTGIETVGAAPQAPANPLPVECNPFDALASNRPVDESCGLQGDPGATGGQHAQNRVKNNFCAFQDGPAARVTRFSFDQLQKRTPSKQLLPWGSRTAIPGSDAARGQLQGIYTTTFGDTIGEGSYVQFVGYILEGHFGGTESVNCDLSTRQNVDIHLALVTVRPSTLDLTNHDSECTSITAEISGHHRPIDWEILGRMSGAGTGKKLTGAQPKLADENQKRPIRVRGQLMFGRVALVVHSRWPSDVGKSGSVIGVGNPSRLLD
jgi:hypothetical protein